MTQLAEADVEALLDAVGEDSALRPEEKELSITLTKADDRARVASEIAGPTRRLLTLACFDVEALRVSDSERFGARVAPDAYTEGTITGVEGTVPIGALKIQSRVRSSSGWANIVSKADRGGGGE